MFEMMSGLTSAMLMSRTSSLDIKAMIKRENRQGITSKCDKTQTDRKASKEGEVNREFNSAFSSR